MKISIFVLYEMILDTLLHMSCSHPRSPENACHSFVRSEEARVFRVKQPLFLQPRPKQPKYQSFGYLRVLVYLKQLSKLLGRFPYSPPWSTFPLLQCPGDQIGEGITNLRCWYL